MRSTTVNLNNNYPPATQEIILQLFQKIRSTNNEEIHEASRQLVFYQENFPGELLEITSKFLLNDELENFVFQISSICINNILSPTLYVRSISNNIAFWRNLDKNVQSTIMQGTFRGLMFPDSTVRNLCAKSVSLIARLELPLSDSIDIFDKIFQIIIDDKYGDWSKLGGIQAITELLTIHTDKNPVIPKNANLGVIGSTIFQITISVLQNQQASNDFKKMAAECLTVSIPYFAESIEDQLETLLKVIISNLQIGMPAYKLLRKFCKFFYNKLVPDPIKLIFDALSTDISSNDTDRLFLIVDFWYRFSKFEFKKLNGTIPGEVFYNISNQLSSLLCQPFLQILPTTINEYDIKISEMFNTDELSDLIVRCIGQFAKIPQNQEIVANFIMSFFQQFRLDDNALIRYSSVLSMFSIVSIENPQITNFLISSIQTLSEMISTDKSIIVRCISIIIFGKIVVHQQKYMTDDIFPKTIELSAQLLVNNDIHISSAACSMLSTIFKHSNPAFILQIFDTICPLIVQLLDRSDIFDDQFFIPINQAITSLFNAAPDSTLAYLNSYINVYNNVGPKLENAIKATFPNQDCQQKIIIAYCSIIRLNCLKIKSIPANASEIYFNIMSNIFDILIYLINSFTDSLQSEALYSIAAMIVVDPAELIKVRINEIAPIIVNIYTSSDSPELIKVAGNILRDLIFLYPSYFSQELAVHLFNVTMKIFKTILYVPVQVWIFSIIGEILPIINDPEHIYTTDVLDGLLYLKNLVIPKNYRESNLIKLQSMLYTSMKLISNFNNFDPSFYLSKRGILFAAALEIAKNRYDDIPLLQYYLRFIEQIVDLPNNYFGPFANYIRREDILNSLKLNPPLTNKGKILLVKIMKRTK
ncbi:hypothetical protein M9Y10_008151 [Tritrichomonas musculus]|uniref:Importin N-terminal domain-containing protein n=1 Tax=Tritrichomonas musculus TaxID=1915356 RepID=A0ABR2IXJ7_9EUKA